MLTHFIERIHTATAEKRPLCIQGGGSKRWYGQAPQGDTLTTRNFTGIVDYDPTELVITARCGTPLSEIEAVLAEQGQMLAFEPPSFGSSATVGGMVAAGLAGPRRAYAGAVRDFLLGVVMLNGRAERLVFGGQVMKNVAGYDVSRLMAGSMGSLGLLLELSIKVLPVPRKELSLRFELSREQALATVNKWAGLPYPISATSWENGHLYLRLSGSEAATIATRKQLGGELLPEADAAAYWRSLREQTHAFFGKDDALWRLSLPSTADSPNLGGKELIEWGGSQRWLKLPEEQAQAGAGTIRAAASAIGGHASLFRGASKQVGVFHPLTPPVLAIHRRLKQAFDPAGIFNPGRLYAEDSI